MKKFIIMTMIIFALIALAACNGNGSAEGNISNSTELSTIPYVGAAHDTHNIVFALDLPSHYWEVRSIQIGADHAAFGYGEHTLTIFYEPLSDFQGQASALITEAFFENTAAELFRLIENLQAVTFSVNHMRTGGDVIHHYDYRFSISRSGAKRTSTIEELPDIELIIQIDVATDELLSTFDNLHLADVRTPGQGEGANLVIWANKPLPNFNVAMLNVVDDSDEWGFQPTDSFGSVSMLLPTEAFIINNYMGLGTLPHRGISFTDERGENTRVFFFTENNAYPEHGGQWIIQEIEADRLILESVCQVESTTQDESYAIIINGVNFDGYTYTAQGYHSPTHVSVGVIWALGLSDTSAGSQIALMYNDEFIGVGLSVVNYLAFDEDRVAVGINDTFMGHDNEYFGVYIPLSLVRHLGFDVNFEGSNVHITGQFNVAINPHPLAIALQNFIDNAQGQTKALMAHVSEGTDVLAIEFVDGFAEATLFVFAGSQVISKEIGSIEGFPFSLIYAGDGNLIKVTGDGGKRSYTMFAIATNPVTIAEEIIDHLTIYAELQDDQSMNYYRFNGGWTEGIEGGRIPITEEEFYGIRSGMGLSDWPRSWRDAQDSTEAILSWVSSTWPH